MNVDQTNRAAELDEFKLYTLTELESVLGVTHRTLQTYVNSGRLKATKVGKWKVTKAQLKEFIESSTTGAE